MSLLTELPSVEQSFIWYQIFSATYPFTVIEQFRCMPSLSSKLFSLFSSFPRNPSIRLKIRLSRVTSLNETCCDTICIESGISFLFFCRTPFQLLPTVMETYFVGKRREENICTSHSLIPLHCYYTYRTLFLYLIFSCMNVFRQKNCTLYWRFLET